MPTLAEETVLPLNPAYTQLLMDEVRGGQDPVMWRNGKEVYTATALVKALAEGNALGKAYLRELIEKNLDGLLQMCKSSAVKFAKKIGSTEYERLLADSLTQGPRALLAAGYRSVRPDAIAWTFMSGRYRADEWADMIEVGNTDALSIVETSLRVVRDLFKRAAQRR